MVYTLKFVVDVELGGHQDEAEKTDEGDCCFKEELVVRLYDPVTFVEGVEEVEGHQREEDIVHVPN